jgi:hypothetical protein
VAYGWTSTDEKVVLDPAEFESVYNRSQTTGVSVMSAVPESKPVAGSNDSPAQSGSTSGEDDVIVAGGVPRLSFASTSRLTVPPGATCRASWTATGGTPGRVDVDVVVVDVVVVVVVVVVGELGSTATVVVVIDGIVVVDVDVVVEVDVVSMADVVGAVVAGGGQSLAA